MSKNIEHLIGWGCNPETVKQRKEGLDAVSSLDGLKQFFRDNHFNCDLEQFMLPVFSKMYEHDANVRLAATKHLSPIGIPQEIVDKYFTGMQGQPYLLLRVCYDEIDAEKKERFISEARELMFDLTKKYLGDDLE